MGALGFVIISLATWRLTSIVYQEEIASYIRKLVGGKYGSRKVGDEYIEEWYYPPTFLGNLFYCFRCLSVWCAFACVVTWYVFPILLVPLACSTVAIYLEERQM